MSPRSLIGIAVIVLAVLFAIDAIEAAPPSIDFENTDISSVDVDFELPNGSLVLLYKLKSNEIRKIIIEGPIQPRMDAVVQVEFEVVKANVRDRQQVQADFIHRLIAMRAVADTFDSKLEGGFFSVLLLHYNKVVPIRRWGPGGVLSIANGRWNEVFRTRISQSGEGHALNNKEAVTNPATAPKNE